MTNIPNAMKSTPKRNLSFRKSYLWFTCVFLFLTGMHSSHAFAIDVTFETTGGVTEACQGSTFVITGNADGGNEDYIIWDWSSDPAGMVTVLDEDIVLFNTNFSATPGDYLVTLTVEDSDGNTGIGNITITLKETPQATITADGPTTFCEGESVLLEADPADMVLYSYKWRRNSVDIPGETGTEYLAELEGTYRVRITADNSCSSSSNPISVTVNELPNVTASNDGPVCEGNDLQLFSQPDGASSYSWTFENDPGFSSDEQNPVLFNIGPSQAGTYTVTVTDNNNCSNSASTLVELVEIQIDLVEVVHNTCFGEENGSITVEASQGNPPYSYNWSNGQSGATIDNLSAGTYTVTVTDAGGCQATLDVEVNENSEVVPMITFKQDLFCHGDENGWAVAQASGGTPGYSYLWSNGSTSSTAMNLSAGVYTVTVTDALGCTGETSVEIFEPDELITYVSEKQDVSCLADDDGWATVESIGGTPDYSYVWSDGQEGPTATNLVADVYTVTTTDFYGCTTETSVTIDEAEDIQIDFTDIQHPSCFGYDDGEITAVPSGGTPDYSYLWSNGETTATISGLEAGIYQVTVTDVNGCQGEGEIELIDPDLFEVNVVDIENVYCYGEDNGSILVETLGGTPDFTYEWSHGADGPLADGLTAGIYSVTVTDQEGCQATAEAEVIQPEEPLDLSIDATHNECYGDENGTATAIVTGGTPFDSGEPYSYLWSNGATTAEISGLEAGTYSLTVTDANGCIIEDSIEILQPDEELTAYAGPDETICSEDNGGSWILGGTDPSNPTADGGVPPYSYQWEAVPEDPSLSGQENLENPVVSPTQETTYTLTVTDDNGCTAVSSATINLWPTVVADAGGDEDGNVFICEGATINLGGTPLGIGNTGYYLNDPDIDPAQFTYHWEQISPGGITFISNEPHPEVSPVETSTYRVRVTDQGGDNCEAYDTVVVEVFDPITADIIPDTEICHPGNNGDGFTLSANISGGSGDYNFYWSADPEDPTLAGQENELNPVVNPLVTTTYTFTVEDLVGIGCDVSEQTVITVWPEVFANAGTDTIICQLSGPDTFTLGGEPTAWGGSGDFDYLWSSVPVDPSLAGQETLPNPEVTPTETTTYTVWVTDENGCQQYDEIVVDVGDALLVDAGEDTEVCHPDNDGEFQLNATVSGGSGNYSYSWTPAEGLSDPEIPNPVASPETTTTYTLTVSDEQGCFSSDDITLTVIDLVVADAGEDQTICHPDNFGEAHLSASGTGGSGVFEFYWTAEPEDPSLSGQESQQNIIVSPTETTVYTLIVTDQGDAACAEVAQVTVFLNEELTVSAGEDHVICNPENGGTGAQLQALPSGGSGDLTFEWSPAEGLSDPNIADPIANPEESTTYVVTVTDSAGCQAVDEVFVEVLPELIADAGADFVACHGVPAEIGGYPAASGGSGSGYTYQWTPAEGLDDATVANPIILSPSGEQTYTLIVTDPLGCTAESEITVTISPEIFADAGEPQTICLGEQVTLGGNPTGSGGTPPYNYYWWSTQDGAISFGSNPTVTPGQTTTFNLTVTDASGCFDGSSVLITVDEPITLDAGEDQTICQGDTTILTATGGTSYLWSTGETESQIQVAPMETTTYTVTSENACGIETDEVTVFVEEAYLVDLGEDIEICSGEIVELNAGTFDNADYLWSTGETEQVISIWESGSYWVEVTNLNNGCISSDEIIVEYLPQPDAETGPDQTICFGEEVTLGPENPEPSPTSTFMWTSDPEDPSLIEPEISNPTVSPSVTTVYTLTETFTDTGCENQNSVTITVFGEEIDAGPDQEICLGESVVIGPDDPDMNNDFYWTSSNPDETFDHDVPNPEVSPMETTTYTLMEYFPDYGCSAIAEVVITVHPLPAADAGTDKEMCIGETITIGPDEFVPSPTSEFYWVSEPHDPSISDPAITNPTVSPGVTTVYTLIETFTTTGCSFENSITVEVLDLPEVHISQDTLICQGEAIHIGDEDAPEHYTYEWTSYPPGYNSNEANPLVSPEETTIFILYVTNQQGCGYADSVEVEVMQAPKPQVVDDILFCNQEQVQTVYIGGDSIDGYTYQWTSIPEGFDSQEANPLAGLPEGIDLMTFIVTATNEFGCSGSDSMQMAVSDFELAFDGEPTFCEDESIFTPGDFVTVTGGTPPYHFEWMTPEGEVISELPDPEIHAPFESYYILNVYDEDGCILMKTFEVIVVPIPDVELVATPDGNLVMGQTVTIAAYPEDYDHYEFFVDNESRQAGSANTYSTNQLETGQEVYVVASHMGCMGISESYFVIITDLPNAFTPDGDGINDIFGEGYDLTIFNRWGQKVFEGKQGWDGTHNGRKVSPGTYYYIMEMIDSNNRNHTHKGSVTVILNRN